MKKRIVIIIMFLLFFAVLFLLDLSENRKKAQKSVFLQELNVQETMLTELVEFHKTSAIINKEGIIEFCERADRQERNLRLLEKEVQEANLSESVQDSLLKAIQMDIATVDAFASKDSLLKNAEQVISNVELEMYIKFADCELNYFRMRKKIDVFTQAELDTMITYFCVDLYQISEFAEFKKQAGWGDITFTAELDEFKEAVMDLGEIRL